MQPVKTPKQRQREEEADHEQEYEHEHMKHHHSRCLKWEAWRAFLRSKIKGSLLCCQASGREVRIIHYHEREYPFLLIGTRELHLLKPGAYLVDCAGGRLIGETALLAALEHGRLAGAALDIFSQERIRESEVVRRLLVHERVIATPHLEALTREALARVATEVARNVVSAVRGDTLIGTILPSFPPMAPP